MPVDERKIRLRAALAGKSTEELDDLLAMSFSEDAEPDVEYIEVILEVMRERDGKVETEEELNRAWADFKEFVKERESLEKEFAETEETSTETGVTEEPSHEHTRKTEYRQKPRRFSRIFRNALLVAAIIALLGSQAFGWNLFQAIAQWGTETFQILTGRENTDASYRDVFEELRVEAGEREYSVQTKEAVNANEALKRENEAFQKWLSSLNDEDKTCIENYLNAVEHAHFQEEQRAYYQGMVDVIQIFMGLGIIKKRDEIEALLNRIVK